MTKKRSKSCKRRYPTSNPDVFAHIVWAETPDKVRVTGYLVNSKGKRLKDFTTTTRISQSLEDREFVIARVRAIIEKKLNYSNSIKRTNVKKTNSIVLNEKKPMVKAFRTFQSSDPYVYGWCSTTLHNHMVYFAKNILPFVQHMEQDEDFGEEELQELKQHLLEKAINNGNSDHRIETAMKRVEDHIASARKIYGELLYIDPMLPDLSMLKGERLSVVAKEQFKFIPFDTHRTFREILGNLVTTDPFYVRGAVLMDMGLRASEAAAVTKNEIKPLNESAYILVIYQEKNGERCELLKSDSAYRMVPCDEWAANILARCNAIIGVESQGQKRAPIIGSKLSAWVKSKLIESGCDEALLRGAQKDLGTSCEYNDSDVQSTDISGHMLRRHRASCMCLVMGYTRDEETLYLGHRNSISEATKEHMLTPQYLQKMFLKNARYDLLGASYCSSPKYVPIEVENGSNINIVPYDIVRIKNSSDEELLEVTLNIEGKVVGEVVEIMTEGNIKILIPTSSFNEDDLNNYNREIIGNINNEEDDDDESED